MLRSGDIIYLQDKDIRTFLYKQNKISLLNELANTIDINYIENVLRTNPFVKRAEVYVSSDGIMYIDVEQRNPALKVYNKKDEVFNVDEDGVIMPNNTEYPAYIRVANGNISTQNINGDTAKNILNNVFLLSKYISEIPFMDTLIEQLYVNDNGNIVLIPNRGNVDIVFGKIANMEDKIRKIEEFYTAIPSFNATGKYTRARYHFADAVIRVENNRVTLPRTTIYDQEGGEGDLTLTLNTRSLSQPSYAVSVTPRGMLALNTTAADNDNFYGKAYASGTVTIAGDPHAIDMQINLATEENSTFYMPLSGASSIAEADFIVFENPNTEAEAASLSRYELMKRMREQAGKNPAQKSAMNLDLNIDVRTGTRVELVIDPQNGGTIEANGTGTLTLHLQPAEDVFTMFGDYRIERGNYQLTLMTVMDKRFTIEPGSSIRWVGDPLNAVLDVTASYHVRTSTAPITGEQEGRMVPVDCQIILSDRLSQPTITFDIALPTADADLRGELQTAMNTQEQKSQQFVWLVMSGNFYGGSTANIGTASTAASTGIEFLTNQLGNWLSTERFNFNFGYTLGNNQMATSDEVEGAFSGELISDKLLFEGEVNYNLGTNTADPRNNQFSGDFYLTYIINRPGSLRAKIFSRTIDRYDENQGLQEQGAGIYYTQDFDRWSELFRRRNAQKSKE